MLDCMLERWKLSQGCLTLSHSCRSAGLGMEVQAALALEVLQQLRRLVFVIHIIGRLEQRLE